MPGRCEGVLQVVENCFGYDAGKLRHGVIESLREFAGALGHAIARVRIDHDSRASNQDPTQGSDLAEVPVMWKWPAVPLEVEEIVGGKEDSVVHCVANERCSAQHRHERAPEDKSR